MNISKLWEYISSYSSRIKAWVCKVLFRSKRHFATLGKAPWMQIRSTLDEIWWGKCPVIPIFQQRLHSYGILSNGAIWVALKNTFLRKKFLELILSTFLCRCCFEIFHFDQLGGRYKGFCFAS